MTDVDHDLSALRTASTRVGAAVQTFASAGRVGEDIADLTGEARLANRVRDFAGNWDHNRAKLEEQLETVNDWLDAIIETFTELDEKMEG